jgi:hypothetical protein
MPLPEQTTIILSIGKKNCVVFEFNQFQLFAKIKLIWNNHSNKLTFAPAIAPASLPMRFFLHKYGTIVPK